MGIYFYLYMKLFAQPKVGIPETELYQTFFISIIQTDIDGSYRKHVFDRRLLPLPARPHMRRSTGASCRGVAVHVCLAGA